MPSLQELLQNIRCGGSDFVGPFTYGFFENVAQALEPEDTNAPIRKLRQRAEVAESRLAEAKATIRRLRVERLDLRVERDGLDQRCSELEHKLTEAKAEIERLRGKCESEELCKGYPDLCAEAEAVIKSIKADATLGAMVRGMRRGGNLRRAGPLKGWGWIASDYANYGEGADDPAEALRSIQEVGDDEA